MLGFSTGRSSARGGYGCSTNRRVLFTARGNSSPIGLFEKRKNWNWVCICIKYTAYLSTPSHRFIMEPWKYLVRFWSIWWLSPGCVSGKGIGETCKRADEKSHRNQLGHQHTQLRCTIVLSSHKTWKACPSDYSDAEWETTFRSVSTLMDPLFEKKNIHTEIDSIDGAVAHNVITSFVCTLWTIYTPRGLDQIRFIQQ